MSEKSLGVAGTAAATVIGGLALAAITGLFTYIWPNTEAAAWIVQSSKAAWAWAGVAAGGLWSLISYPLPTWLVLLLCALCVWLWSRRARPPAPTRAVVLTDAENRLIELLAAADGAFVHVAVIAEVLNTRKLAVESVSERLTQFGLLVDSLGPSGTLLKLSPRGRDYALEHQLIGDQGLADRLHEVAMDRSGRI